MTALPLTYGPQLRTYTVTPGMCGSSSLLAGRLGDWTWDAVSSACGVNAYRAFNDQGAPTYLSFYYFRIRGSRRLHPLRITFGDQLQVVSQVFAAGSESVLTLHRVRYDTGGAPEPFDITDFYERPDQNSLLVENFNRWITRTREHSNRDLARSSPTGFRYAHLPTPPEAYSPRLAYANARTNGSFLHQPPAGKRHVVRNFVVDYPIDPSRDLNGVGLLYFASYFAIVDWALLRLWRHLGRDVRDYLDRVVLDQRLCYLGNADGDAVLRIELNLWRDDVCSRDELIEMVLYDRTDNRRLAVCALHVCSPEVADGVG